MERGDCPRSAEGGERGGNIHKFDGKSSVYSAARPDYADGVFEFLFGSCGLGRDSVVADVGSGTGKFSSQLLRRQVKVYAVEPNAEMRGEAERLSGGDPRFVSVRGSAERTTLPDRSVDLVTAAQAFHWFDQSAFAAECARILRGQGRVALVYNHRVADDGLNGESAAVFKAYCPSFRGFSGGFDPAQIDRFFHGPYERAAFEHPLKFDGETFVQRCLSSSYALRPHEEGYAAFLSAVKALFKKYARNGEVVMDNRSVVYLGRVK